MILIQYKQISKALKSHMYIVFSFFILVDFDVVNSFFRSINEKISQSTSAFTLQTKQDVIHISKIFA